MSRTDHHAPHWATCTWYEPVHDLYCVDDTGHRRWAMSVRDRHVCDLPARPVRRRPQLVRRVRRVNTPGETLCTWEPDWAGVSAWPRPPRWYVEHVWHNAERVRARDVLRLARAEYNATGNTDVEPEPRQARHGASYHWS